MLWWRTLQEDEEVVPEHDQEDACDDTNASAAVASIVIPHGFDVH